MSALPNEMSYVENKIHHMMISYLMWSNKSFRYIQPFCGVT